MEAKAVQAIVERAATAWMTGDAAAFASLFTADGECIVPGNRWVGQKAIAAALAEFAAGHTNVKISVRQIVADGDHAVVEWSWEDTETATGKRTVADDAIAVDFVRGQIRRWREYIDAQTPSRANGSN
ncbi:SgcJ/EcaC family oxidoreductase [Gloeobacter kilaueensis]|uniref:SnoaL-like domain-containing protein n=1 Tax=Gloeobacter kilaueensis (strain ATCC BAA-2537 / CCAP 1431/1 / ULC 316 / JS1) TaxID=1183438 RepID=U5QJ93_GLOK1|nr:SgcJ/EcaC family oxidoreductase [Gloeobacter kilaueensis]AGY59052.1 hypothetical protein GKIL_2806 [Gloeobacter kilaueensis JS1]